MARDDDEVMQGRVERILSTFDFAAAAGVLRRHGRRPRGDVRQREVDLGEVELRSLGRRLLLQVCREAGGGAAVCESGGLLALRTPRGELRLYRVAGEMCG